MVTRFEHADMIASSRSSQPKRRSGFSSCIPSASTASKSNVRTSESSCDASGRTAASTRHHDNRCACFWLGFFISLRMGSYVSSRPSGKSSRIPRILCGKQCRRTSSWQNAHRNICQVLRFGYGQMATRLPSIRFLR
jgi:hypothetical protein